MSIMLVADDNQQLLNILNSAAVKEGYETLLATDGEMALQLFNTHNPQIVLLDVMMPKLDGFAVCRKIRENANTPVIMITARGEDFEKIMGLDIGADDYIVKPFSIDELMARIRAILRRVEKADDSNNLLCIQDLTINMDTYQVSVHDIPILLTKREVDMLYTLVSGKNRAFTREMLLDLLWGYDYYGDARTVDSHIKRLRAKLDAVDHPTWEIRTIRNIGYKFEVIQ